MQTNTENELNNMEGEGQSMPELEAEINAKVMPDNEIYAESMKDKEAGSVVKGTIIRITDSDVFVDIGYKSEGNIPIEEFKSLDGTVSAKVGDEIEVFIRQQEDRQGRVILSKSIVDRKKIWQTLEEKFRSQEILDAKLVKQIKGGYLCNIGTEAFLPASQVGYRHSSKEDVQVGSVLKVRIIKYDPARKNVVVSNRSVLEEEAKKNQDQMIQNLKMGDKIKGRVKSLTDFGAFVDIGGVFGLLHVSEISWNRISNPAESLKVGDELEVLVINIDKEKGKISLSLKQLAQDPWQEIESRYQAGMIVKGIVRHITDYGVFVSLDNQIEGLIHISEVSWDKSAAHPREYLKADQEIDVKILKVDKTAKRISLGVKQLQPNPLETALENLSVGSLVTGTVTSLVRYGVFVEIVPGVEGLVHNTDISWSGRISTEEILKKGDTVNAIILSIDKENGKVSLGIKQLQPDPWSMVINKYKVGDIVTGKILRFTTFGAFVEIEPGIEGLLHISQIDTKRVAKVENFLKAGEQKIMKIIKISPEERKISLSIKKYLKDQEREKNPEKMGDISLETSL